MLKERIHVTVSTFGTAPNNLLFICDLCMTAFHHEVLRKAMKYAGISEVTKCPNCGLPTTVEQDFKLSTMSVEKLIERLR